MGIEPTAEAWDKCLSVTAHAAATLARLYLNGRIRLAASVLALAVKEAVPA